MTCNSSVPTKNICIWHLVFVKRTLLNTLLKIGVLPFCIFVYNSKIVRHMGQSIRFLNPYKNRNHAVCFWQQLEDVDLWKQENKKLNNIVFYHTIDTKIMRSKKIIECTKHVLQTFLFGKIITEFIQTRFRQS